MLRKRQWQVQRPCGGRSRCGQSKGRREDVSNADGDVSRGGILHALKSQGGVWVWFGERCEQRADTIQVRFLKHPHGSWGTRMESF